VLEGQCARASKPLACSISGTCWWVTTGAADIWEITVVLDAEEDSYNLLTVASWKSILVPSPTPQCFARIDQVLVASSNRTNSQIYMVIIRHSYYCSSPRVRWRAWAAWGSYILWQELVMDYIIVVRITKRLMWLSRCLRHRIATRLRFHVHDASHDPTLESIHVDFTPYIKCTLLLSCDGGYVYTFAKYLSVLVNSCCWRALYWWSWQKKVPCFLLQMIIRSLNLCCVLHFESILNHCKLALQQNVVSPTLKGHDSWHMCEVDFVVSFIIP
jgi:hypothetical protein